MEEVLSVTKTNFPPTSATENMQRWRKPDLSTRIHTSDRTAILQWAIPVIFEAGGLRIWNF